MATRRGAPNDDSVLHVPTPEGDTIQWVTHDPSDDPFTETEAEPFDPSSQLLEVPELTPDVLEQMAAQAGEGGPSQQAEPAAPTRTQHGEPGSYVNCEVCGKSVRVKRDGTLSQHRCEAPSQRGTRFEHLPAPKPAPKKVREFCINVIAWGVEESSAQVLARATGTDSQDVPSELPDAEEMIGPPLDILWPHIPESAQDFIGMLADNSQLISCALLWGEWIRTLGAWTRDARAYQQSILNEGNAHGQAQSRTAGIGVVRPFRPAQPD